jgi:membrane-associated phospholipid phosphatase
VSEPDVSPPVVTRKHALVAVAACFALVGILGVGVLTHFAPQMDLDGAVSEELYVGDRRAVFLNDLLQVLTAPGVQLARIAVFLPVVLYLLVRRMFRTALWVTLAAMLIGPLNTLLKVTFGRVRPDFDQGGARLASLSYPSGHSSGIATLVTVSLLLIWPLMLRRAVRITALVLGAAFVLLVGLTRMWLGVHFLTDVLGGWSLGVGWSLLVATVLGGLPGHRAALPSRERAEVR